MSSPLLPLPPITLSQLVASPKEVEKVQKWVVILGLSPNNTEFIRLIRKIPQANISTNNLRDSELKEHLQYPFKYLCIREIREVLSWMKEQLDPKQFEGNLDHPTAFRIRMKTSPMYFLFYVIKKALIEKQLHKDFQKEPVYQALQFTFAFLQEKNLVTL